MRNAIWQVRASSAAELLLEELGISTLPVSPMEIASALGVEVRPLPPRSQPGVSGVLLRYGNEFGILYSTSVNSPGFQNFSIGHEIGHLRLPNHPESILIDGAHSSSAGFYAKDRFELEADHFSAAMLMPRRMFDRALDRAGAGLEAVEKLADQCQTSLLATAIRYAERCTAATAIVVSNGRQVEYSFMSELLRDTQGLEWIKKGGLLPLKSVTRALNESEANVRSGSRAIGIGDLQDWFGGRISTECCEEAVGLGDYGKTLTVLTIDDLPDIEEREEEEALIESWSPKFK